MPTNTGQKQGKPGQWPKGVSGNPKGRRAGSKHKATIACQMLLDGESQALTRKCIELALGGDLVALRLCLERLVPPRKDSTIQLKLPKVSGPEDILPALGVILEAVAGGKITPAEGRELGALLSAYRQGVDVSLQVEQPKAVDLSDFSTEELELLVSLGLKLQGKENPLAPLSESLTNTPERSNDKGFRSS